jgi:hypothetical protein
MIQDFTGGSDAVRGKLNEMVREINALANIRGDEHIRVKYLPGVGLALNFVNNPILNGGGTAAATIGNLQKQGMAIMAVTQNETGGAFPFIAELI